MDAIAQAKEYGLGSRAVPDRAVLAAAHLEERGLLTLNRKHFWRLHESGVGHRGIVACTFDPDFERQARRIDLELSGASDLTGAFIRVNRPPSPG